MTVGSFFFSAAPPAQNSPELHFCFINFSIHPSRVGSLVYINYQVAHQIDSQITNPIMDLISLLCYVALIVHLELLSYGCFIENCRRFFYGCLTVLLPCSIRSKPVQTSSVLNTAIRMESFRSQNCTKLYWTSFMKVMN